MTASLVIQIVPALPPPEEGVGSYALALAGALSARGGLETRFVTGADAHRPAALLAALETGGETRVLLHYANYGYHRRGCPTGLVEGLGRWLRRGAGRKLVTLFHEIWATGPPWRSSFWLAPVQRRLAATLARLSTRTATSLELYARTLRPWAKGRPVHVMPVFSTIGEPAAAPPPAARAPRLVVFGGSGARSRAWGRELPALAAACKELAIEEIVDVGPPAAVPDRIGAVPVRALGVLPAREVGTLLLGSRAGFLAYPPSFLPKSTIFAAYSSHGVVPVCAWSGRERCAGPRPPLWESGADPAAAAERARAWYGEHALARQAEVFLTSMLEETA